MAFLSYDKSCIIYHRLYSKSNSNKYWIEVHFPNIVLHIVWNTEDTYKQIITYIKHVAANKILGIFSFHH